MIFNYNKNFYQLINNNMLSTHQTIQPFFVFVAISLVKLKHQSIRVYRRCVF